MSETVPEVPIRVFLLIENRLLRDVLQRLLRKRSDLVIAGCNEPGACSPQAVERSGCDVLLLDFFDSRWLPGNLASKSGGCAVPKALLIGMNDESDQFLAAIRGGVTGYLLKEASAAEVVAAVRAAFRGEAVCPPRLCAALFDYVSQTGMRASVASDAKRPALTLRQQRLIGLVAKGLTNKEIASQLNISQFTVKNHIHRILRNVDAESRSQAVDLIRSRGYLPSAVENV